MSVTKRAIPNIIDEPNEHITKKAYIDAGLSLKKSPVPKSPVKQSLSLTKSDCGAISISYRENSQNNLSSLYDSACDQSYFDQCFYDVDIIGEGAFGIVFRVRSKEDDQLYAIKKSKYPFRSNHDKKSKLEEVRKHELIPKHPNCVQLYRSWIEDNYLYLQMELCDITLETYAAQNHSIPEEMLWNILTDLLLALKNLHDANLIHLDVKLENILMCSNGVCKLCDFGLVCDLSKIEPNPIEGDQKYLAPELLTGHFTKAADIFSLGIVMLELSCDLMLPQNGTLWQELRNDTFPNSFVQDLSQDLFEVIKKMMASDYLQRPTVDELLEISRIQQALPERRLLHRCHVHFNSFPRHQEEENSPIYLSPISYDSVRNSTPTFPGIYGKYSWHIEIPEISPIPRRTELMDEDCEQLSAKKKRPLDGHDSLRISSSVLCSTPRSHLKRSRVTHHTVGRQLFR